MDYNNLESLINHKRVSKRQLATAIGMSNTGFLKMIKQKTMTIAQLEAIAAQLEVSPCELLDLNHKTENKQNPTTSHLEQLLKEKEKQIKDKEEIITLLKKQIK